MTREEFYQQIADATGEELATIESYGFEPHVPQFNSNRKELKRQRRLRLWRQQRRDRRLAAIANKQLQS